MRTPTAGTSVYNGIAYTKTNTTPRDITGVGFPPDLAHYKGRSGGANSGIDNNVFFDRLRGARSLITNNTSAEAAGAQEGTMLQDGIVTSAAGEMNYETGTAILHFFRRAPGFFDEVCWTYANTTNERVTHNLGVAPELIIVKSRNAVSAWPVYISTSALSSGGIDKYGFFNRDLPFSSNTNTWGTSNPTTTTFGLSPNLFFSAGQNLVAYLFASCPGVSKVGSFDGTGSPIDIDCGFTNGARFVMIKRFDDSGPTSGLDWFIWDSARGIVAGNDPYLRINSTAAEVTGTDYVDTYSAGFTVNGGAGAINASGGTYIFLAIA